MRTVMSHSNMPMVNPARQAERILEAWASGNEPLLQEELQRSQGLRSAPGQGLDEERLELLHAVATGILRLPAPLQSGKTDPSVRRCLDLLAHLAGAPCEAAGFARSSC